MPLNIEIPQLEHKYIRLYDTEAEYEADKDTYEEACYSIVKSIEAIEDNYSEYQYSTRTTNNDNEVKGKYWDMEVPNIYAGLEIIWGYFGWEWIDFEWNGETLKGGNFYIVKPMGVVKSIPDGDRLQHINNFITNVSTVRAIEYFNTDNIKYLYHFIILPNILNTSYTINCDIHTFLNCKEVQDCIGGWFSRSDYRYSIKLTLPENHEYFEFPIVISIKNFYCDYNNGFIDLDSIYPIKTPNCKVINPFCNTVYKYAINNIDINVNDYILESNKLEEFAFIKCLTADLGFTINIFKYDINVQNEQNKLIIYYLLGGKDENKINTINNIIIINNTNIILSIVNLFSNIVINNISIPNTNLLLTGNVFSKCTFNCTPPWLSLDYSIINEEESYVYNNCTFATDDAIFNFNHNNANVLIYENKLINSATFTGAGKIINFGYLNDIILSWTQNENFIINEDLTIEGLEYTNRHISISSNFITIKEQTIDVYYDSNYTIIRSDVADFIDNDFTINISCNNNSKLFSTNTPIFYIPNATISPILIGSINRRQTANVTIYIVSDTSKLVDLRCENFNYILNSYHNYRTECPVFNFNFLNLVYLRIGRLDGSIDIAYCKKLDINILKESLLKQISNIAGGYVTTRYLNIWINIYNQLDEETITHIIEVYDTINIYEDESN